MTSSDFVRSGVPQCKVVGQSRAAGSPVPLTRPNTTFCLLESIFNANYEQIKRILNGGELLPVSSTNVLSKESRSS